MPVMKKIIYCLIICISLAGLKTTYRKTQLDQMNPDIKHISFLALGDSYTIGESVDEDQTFPMQTAQLLTRDSIITEKPDIIAVTGWTTTDLLNALDKMAPPKKSYSLVSLLIGVNNQFQGKSLQEYAGEFTRLLNRSVQYAGNNRKHVFVLSIPDYSVTPFAAGSDTAKIAAEIDAFNFMNRTIAQKAGVHYLDITVVSREAKNDPRLIAADGLHPSSWQYKRWSELLSPMMEKEIY
jgi:lysophospholipase L1-like esterase